MISPSAISPLNLPLVSGGGFVGLLDTYGGAAAAYSVRRLSSTYTGNLIEVRRSSDNTIQDIGYDANGDLDTTALLSFVGAGNGFVRTWYDQSGNSNDIATSTTTEQPQIISSGVLTLDNGKAAVDFDGSNDVLYLSTPINLGTTHYVFNTLNQDTGGTIVAFGSDSPVSNFNTFATGYQYNAQGSFGSGGTNNISSQILKTLYRQGTTSINVNENSTNVSSFSMGGANNDFYFRTLGARYSGKGFYFNGKQQELIIYTTDQSANQAGIESNINTYFSIY